MKPALLYLLAETKINPGQLPSTQATNSTIVNILNIALSILGALSLLVITISGLRYIASAGDPQKASSAKNGIIYALVGLAIAIMAESIVLFVGKKL